MTHIIILDSLAPQFRFLDFPLQQDQLKRLFIEHRQPLQAYLSRMLRQPELVADLIQETFLRCAERASNADIQNERSYLYRIAHNLAIDHIRQQQRRRTDSVPVEELHDIADVSGSLETQAEARSHLEYLHKVIQELSPRTRQVFALNRIEGLTHKQVAERLNISDSSVQKHLSTALQHVMARMKSR